MECGPIEELLPGYLDNELSSDGRRRVDAHLEACGSCRALLHDLRRVDSIVAGWSDPPDAMRPYLSGIDGTVLGRLGRGRWLRPSLVLARRALSLAVTAAIVLIVIGLGFALLLTKPRIDRARQTISGAPSGISRPLLAALGATAAPGTPGPGQGGLLGGRLANVAQVTVTDFRQTSSKTVKDQSAIEPMRDALIAARFVRHDATLESQVDAQTYLVHLLFKDGTKVSLIYWPGGGSPNVEEPRSRDWWNAPGLDAAMQRLLPSPSIARVGTPRPVVGTVSLATPVASPDDSSTPAGALPSAAVSIAVSPERSATLYALLVSNALYRSDDQGRTWRSLPLPAAENLDRAHSVPGDLDPDTILDRDVAVQATGANRVFAVADRVLYGSQDGGTSWKALFDAVYAWTVADPSGNVLYVWHATVPSEPAGLYRTDDAGQTWREVYGGDFPPALQTRRCPCNHEGMTGLIADPRDSNTVYAVSDYGIFRSVDAGKTWAEPKSGLTPGRFYRWTPLLTAEPDGTIIALTDISPDYASGSAALIRLRPGESSWTTVGKAALDRWQSADAPFYGFKALLADPFHAGRLYVGSEKGLLRSDDGGATWRSVGLPSAHTVFEVSIASGSKETPTTLDLWTDHGFATWTDEGH
ncbi:MAG: zf-HC2 domain-containing protein [Chloroflexota bacterium]